jgi:hypothetical protein
MPTGYHSSRYLSIIYATVNNVRIRKAQAVVPVRRGRLVGETESIEGLE